jgi:hypothetical protein
MVASAPSAGRLAPANIASIAFAPVSPSIPFKENKTCEVTASWPKKTPAIAMAIERRALAGILVDRPVGRRFLRDLSTTSKPSPIRPDLS